MALESTPPSEHDRSHHVGYFLISRGRFRLEREVGYPPALSERLGRFVYGHPVLGYLGAIALGSALAVASFVAYAQRHGGHGLELWLVALIVLLPLSELAISVINLLITSQITPRPLPKLDMRDGIPAGDRTFVVVPAIFDSEARLNSLIDHLEVRFFANRDPHLHFALLSDFADARQRTQPQDAALIDTARRRIDELNVATAPTGSFSSIAPASGIPARRGGWDTSGSGASWRNSTACCAGRPIRASSCSTARWRSCRASAT